MNDPLSNFWETLQPLSAATSLDQLREQLRGHGAALGFSSFVYALRVPTGFSQARLLMLDGYPAGWVPHYFERGHHAHDPVLAHCTGHNVPVQWQHLPTAAGSPGRLMMEEAADFGLRAGVTMPVHSPHGELGVLSLALDAPPRAARECLRWAADGKTSGEIGQLLHLAQSTVNFHLNKAMHKLQVCNRQHAVARAVLQARIQPQPF